MGHTATRFSSTVPYLYGGTQKQMKGSTLTNSAIDQGAPELRGRDFSLQDRVVIVTGAGQGIGREYARQLGAAGAVAVVVDIVEANAKSVVAEIESAGGRAVAHVADVSNADQVDAVVTSVVTELGRIDGLVNNAAIFSTLEMRGFEQIPLDEWRKVLEVNVTGPFLFSRAVSPIMRKAGFGRIIHVASDAVHLGLPNYLHSVASKAAVEGITKSMSRELGPHGITVNAVSPGGTFTEVPRATLTEEGKARLIANQCIQREEVPTDLAGLVLFLNSEAAGFITGQVIACDGGLTHRS